MGINEPTDGDLLAATRSDPGAFASFYDRYETAVVGYFMRVPFYLAARPTRPGNEPGRTVTVTVRPVGNVVVARIPSRARTARPAEIIWRSAGGAILKKIGRG